MYPMAPRVTETGAFPSVRLTPDRMAYAHATTDNGSLIFVTHFGFDRTFIVIPLAKAAKHAIRPSKGFKASQAYQGTLHDKRIRRNFATNRNKSCVLGQTPMPQSIGIGRY